MTPVQKQLSDQAPSQENESDLTNREEKKMNPNYILKSINTDHPPMDVVDFMTLGSDSSCHFHFVDESISPRHLRFEFRNHMLISTMPVNAFDSNMVDLKVVTGTNQIST